MIRKAVIPAAGFGTRFLPFTKSVPKEMIPVVDKPTIQYVVEEAVASGVTDVLIIVSAGKQAIQDHFSRNLELERRLEETGKLDALEEIRRISELANVHYVHQLELNGLGSAIHCAKSFVGQDPFVVLLGDTITTSESKPVTSQLIDVHEARGGSVVALEEVPREMVSRYGVVDPESIDGRVVKVRGMVEKPDVEKAPSNLVVASRYLFTPEIFGCIERTPRGKNNEVQITDAMRLLLEDHPLFGCRIEGKRHDVGSKEGFVNATIEFAKKRKLGNIGG